MIFIFVVALIFALGPLLGPIGLMIALTGRGDRSRCPACDESVDPEATKCQRCSAAIALPQAAVPDATGRTPAP